MQPGPDTPAFQPLYRQIKALITQALVAGEWRPGEAIPSESDLAARFGVSQGTVRKAVGELAAENLLTRLQGKGTFVASHAQEGSQLPFLRVTPDEGPLEEVSATLVGFRRGRAEAAVARALGLSGGAGVFRVDRVLRLAGRPVALDEVWLPAVRFRGLGADVIEQHECMLYSLYESVFRLRVLSADERLKAVAATPQQAHWLGLQAGDPCLRVERIAYTYGREPAELRRSYVDTRTHHYRNQITG